MEQMEQSRTSAAGVRGKKDVRHPVHNSRRLASCVAGILLLAFLAVSMSAATVVFPFQKMQSGFRDAAFSVDPVINASSEDVVSPLRGQGVKIHVEIANMPGTAATAGLAANRNVSKGDLLVSIPLQYVFYHGWYDSRIRSHCETHACDEIGALIVAFALEARTPTLHFATYISSLPKVVPNMNNFNQEQMQILKLRYGKVAFDVTQESMVNARTINEQLELQMSIEELRWSHSIVESRAFSIELLGGSFPCLLPVIDMLNHGLANTVSASIVNCDYDACRIWATREIPEGTHIFGSYGDLSNLDLLTKYGFKLAMNFVGPYLLGIYQQVLGEDLATRVSSWLPDFGCSPLSLKTGPRVRRNSTSGAVEADVRCLFLALSFDSKQEAQQGLQDGAYDCIDGSSTARCTNDAWRQAAVASHKALQLSCLKLAQLWSTYEMTSAVGKLEQSTHPITPDLISSIVEEVQLVKGCLNHHRDAIRELQPS